MIASRHGDFPVKKGDKLAGTRIIPLVIEKEKMDRAAEAAGTEPVFSILPYKKKKVGIVTTGSEVQKGLITDTFTPVLRDKFAKFPSGSTLIPPLQTTISAPSSINFRMSAVICSISSPGFV